MNTKQTLASEIKFSFKGANIPLIIFGSIFISLIGHFMVLGYNPELLNDPVEIHVIFVLFMAFFIGLSLSVALVFLGASLYCKPKIMQYVNVPKDIEDVRDGLIALGSYVTSLDKTVVSTGLSSIFYYIIKQLKKLDIIESDVKQLKTESKEKEKHYINIIKEQKQELYNNRLEKKKDNELIKKLLNENNQLVKENTELRKEKNEKIQTMNEKAHGTNITENANLKKLKDLDE
jgi:hypothetical protein